MPTNSNKRAQKTSAPAAIKSNPARGEVVLVIDDKNLLLVPTFQNIAAVEDELDGAISDIVFKLAEQSPRFRIGHIVPLIHLLNEGDEIDREALSVFLRTNPQGAVETMTKLAFAILDPTGTAYAQATDESNEAADPNV